MPQSALPNPQFTPRRIIALSEGVGRTNSGPSSRRGPSPPRSSPESQGPRTSAAPSWRVPGEASSCSVGAKPGPNRTGSRIRPLSKPYLNTLRTRWMRLRMPDRPHFFRVILFRSTAKSSVPRSVTSRAFPKLRDQKVRRLPVGHPSPGRQLAGIQPRLLEVQEGVGQVLDRDTR